MDRNEGYLPVPTFDYSSAFNYTSVLSEDFGSRTEEDNYEASASRKNAFTDPLQQFAYYLLISLSFILFLVTAPISSFYCIKKVNSLQRCLTHRLGVRLPLKGPGLILKLPFVDHVSIIDLYEERFKLVDTETELLTSDGSILNVLPSGEAVLGVTNAVLTTLKLAQVDVKECLRLRFGNVLRSKHIEDLENKMDYTVKQYEENCNRFLQRWGYSLRVEEMPRFTVIERADPLNPIKNKLNQLLNPDGNSPSSPAEALLNMISPHMPDLVNYVKQQTPQANTGSGQIATQSETFASKPATQIEPLNDSELTRALPVLESFLDQYKTYLQAVYTCFNVLLTVDDQNEALCRHCFFQYSADNQGIRPLTIEPAAIHFTVHFTNHANFEHFLLTRDLQCLQYSFA